MGDTSESRLELRGSILNNRVAVWAHTQHDWNIFDLRNFVRDVVQMELALVGYVLGYAYDLDIVSALCQSRSVDIVFGIDMPCLATHTPVDAREPTVVRIKKIVSGPGGLYVARCLTDLQSALKTGEDAAFYCYRAIEFLRQHCAFTNGIDPRKGEAWIKFRDVSGATRTEIDAIKDGADPVRHGGFATIVSNDDRVALYTSTWRIVAAYLAAIELPPM